MDHYLFAVRSATQAQRAARVLNSGGIHASVQRVPVEFARQGCTYAVRVDEADYDVAQQRLQQAHLMPELGFEEVLRLPNDRGCGVDTVYYRHENAPSA